MSRIRTIKPEFWTSEQVVECTPLARLLFIGMWNFCDDSGIHPASPKRLKMEVFPGDDITAQQVDELVDELVRTCLVTRYSIDSDCYWKITGWEKHQRIEKPTYKYPLPDGTLPQTGSKIRQPIPERSQKATGSSGNRSTTEWNGKEWNGKERNGMDTGATAVDLPSWVEPELWCEFLAHRVEIGAPASQRAQKLLLTELAKLRSLGDSPTDIINQAILHGWKGFYPLKRNNGNGHGDKPNGTDHHTESDEPAMSQEEWAQRLYGASR